MTIRERLIEAGLWDASDSRDPVSDPSTIEALTNKIREKYPDIQIGYLGVPTESVVLSRNHDSVQGAGATKSEMLCNAAVKLYNRGGIL